MKTSIFYLLAGFLSVPLIIAIVYGIAMAIKKREPKKEEKPTPEKKKKGGLGWVGFLLIFIALAIGVAYYTYTPPTKIKAVATKKPQRWQICWQKQPDYEGVSALRRLCLPAKIRTKTRNRIVIGYGHSQTNGVIEATAGGSSRTYNGNWKDTGDWGKIYNLHFTSPRTAMAWYDEEGRGRRDFSFILERID